MKLPPAILNIEDRLSVMLGFVAGKYISPSGETCVDAMLCLYLNDDFKKFPYTIRYIDYDGGYCGRNYPFEEDVSVAMVLLETWYSYKIQPDYWVIPEIQVESLGLSSDFAREYLSRLEELRNCVVYFNRKEKSKIMVYGEHDDRHEEDRLFYPSKPNHDDVNYKGVTK